MSCLTIFLCECGHRFEVECDEEFEGEDWVTKVGIWDDLCPKCGAQAEIIDDE